MKTIYKYPLQNVIEIPEDAKLLWIHEDPNENMCLWAEVDTDKPVEKLYCAIIGTGWNIQDTLNYGYKYFSSFLDGPYVWHVYLKKEE